MKTRHGFVSNSSSSSFVILKDGLTEEQLEKISDHINEAKQYGDLFICDPYQAWTVTDKGKVLELSTGMDNFDMETWLEMIKIPKENIIKGHML